MAQAGLRGSAAASEGTVKVVNKRGPHFWCTMCFSYVKNRLFDRHLGQKQCPALHRDVRDEEVKGITGKLKAELRRGLDSIAPNMFFNPDNFEDRMYSKAEVCHILEQWGHQSIPVQHRGNQCILNFKPMKGDHVTFAFKDEADHFRQQMLTARAVSMVSAPEPTVQPQQYQLYSPLGNKTIKPGTYAYFDIPEVTTTTVSTSGQTIQPQHSLINNFLGNATMEPGTFVSFDNQEQENETFHTIINASSDQVQEMPQCESPQPGPSGLQGTGDDTEYFTPERDSFSSSNDSDPDKDIRPRQTGAKRTLALTSSDEEMPSVPERTSGPRRSPYGNKRPRQSSPRHAPFRVKSKINFEKGTKGVANEDGWYCIPTSYKKQTIFSDFERWYVVQGKKPNNQLANIHRMFYHMSKGDPVFKSQYITVYSYMACNDTMTKYGYKTPTLVNYNKAMKHFLKFYLNDSRIGLKQSNRKEYDRLKGIQNEIKLIFNWLENKRRLEQKDEETHSSLPPNPYVIQTVLRLAKNSFEGLMDKAKYERLGKYEVSHVNRHMCCYICLSQGHKPSVPQHLTLSAYQQSISRPTINKYNDTYCVIRVADAQIVLNSEWTRIFDNYVKFVRQPIVDDCAYTPPNFFLQSDGKAFSKISSALTLYQKQFGINKPYTCTDARKSFVTFSGRMSPGVRDDIREFLAHKVARFPYQYDNSTPAVDASIVLRGMTTFNQVNPDVMPTERETINVNEQPSAEPLENTATEYQPFHSAPGTNFNDKKELIIDYLLKQQNVDNFRNVKIPSTLDLRKLFSITVPNESSNMNRALRYRKEIEWAKYVGRRACKDYAKRRKIAIGEISDVQDVNVPEHLTDMIDGYCSEKSITRAIRDFITEEKKNLNV